MALDHLLGAPISCHLRINQSRIAWAREKQTRKLKDKSTPEIFSPVGIMDIAQDSHANGSEFESWHGQFFSFFFKVVFFRFFFSKLFLHWRCFFKVVFTLKVFATHPTIIRFRAKWLGKAIWKRPTECTLSSVVICRCSVAAIGRLRKMVQGHVNSD